MNTSRIAIEKLEKDSIHNEILNAEIMTVLATGVMTTNVAITCHTIDLINGSNLSPKNKLIAHGINLGTFAIASAVIGIFYSKSQGRIYYFTNAIVETANKGIVDECEENS